MAHRFSTKQQQINMYDFALLRPNANKRPQAQHVTTCLWRSRCRRKSKSQHAPHRCFAPKHKQNAPSVTRHNVFVAIAMSTQKPKSTCTASLFCTQTQAKRPKRNTSQRVCGDRHVDSKAEINMYHIIVLRPNTSNIHQA